MATRSTTIIERVLELSRIDFSPVDRQPSRTRLVIASALSIAGSLAADAALVLAGTALFPSTQGYVHFRFSDYAKLTVIGVIVACVAWPVVTRLSSAPRWLFFRMAILVTLVLWLPDLMILATGQPPKAVAVLMVMHIAIALVTYNSLVRLAAVANPGRAPGGPPGSLIDVTDQIRRLGARDTGHHRLAPSLRREQAARDDQAPTDQSVLS